MRRFIFMGSLLLAMTTPAMAAQVYKWVDDKGITHFGSHPPEGTPAASISTSTSQPKSGFPLPPPPKAPAPASPKAPVAPSPDDQQKTVDEKVKRDIAQQEAERGKYCAGLRTNLSQLKNNPRVRVQEENGEMRRLPEEERQQRITQTEQAIRENCN
ncbi:hypothetical protein D9M71_89520 [compost metagenome]